MAKAVIPRMQGDDYQARFFWLQACRLFEDHSKVSHVGYELESVRFFDDVAIFYTAPIPDERGDAIRADYFQTKFHMNQAGAFTWHALMDPSFIGVQSLSLLQRLLLVQKELAPDGRGCRFHIVAPWQVHPDDELAELTSNQGGELRLEVMFDGTTARSAMGKIRTAWRQHLDLGDDEELRNVLRPLRIWSGAGHLQSVRDRLNDKLRLAGLLPIRDEAQSFVYDDLIRKIRATGQSEFTRDQLREICEREGLWCKSPKSIQQATQIGVRSFLRWAEHMEDETECMLCLVPYFDNRLIRDPRLWQENVLPELSSFLREKTREPRCYHLHLDVHTSIAFGAGYCLPPKSGVNVIPIQKTSAGSIPWQPCCVEQTKNSAMWSCQEIVCNPNGTDVAIAVSATHDVLKDVQIYLQQALPEASRIVSFVMNPKPSSTAIRDGTHALSLAQDLVAAIKQRSTAERMGRLHIFAAAPNALTFFLGQLSHGFGSCVLYEYDFEGNTPGAYRPSLTFPT